MDKQRRKELMEQYKEMKTFMGIIQVKNKDNGKIWIAAYPNLKNQWTSIKAQLKMGRHQCTALQKDWNEYGEEAFEYEILEQKDDKDVADKKWELKQMIKPWHERLTPYDEKGYNKPLKD